MTMNKIKLVMNTLGELIYPGTEVPYVIEQYATNYLLELGIVPDKTTEIQEVRLIITVNGKSTPPRSLYLNEYSTFEEDNIEVWTYQLNQYDTGIYSPDGIEITPIIIMADEKHTIVMPEDKIIIPMNKTNFNRFTPENLKEDSSLNSMVININENSRKIQNLIDVGIPYLPVSEPTPNTLILRDNNGRSQVAEPQSDNDISTKKYVDDVFSGLKGGIADLYTIGISIYDYDSYYYPITVLLYFTSTTMVFNEPRLLTERLYARGYNKIPDFNYMEAGRIMPASGSVFNNTGVSMGSIKGIFSNDGEKLSIVYGDDFEIMELSKEGLENSLYYVNQNEII